MDVANETPLGSIILVHEMESGKVVSLEEVSLGELGRVGLTSNEEAYISELEGGGESFCASLLVLAREC